jgi:hypothetical protein
MGVVADAPVPVTSAEPAVILIVSAAAPFANTIAVQRSTAAVHEQTLRITSPFRRTALAESKPWAARLESEFWRNESAMQPELEIFTSNDPREAVATQLCYG